MNDSAPLLHATLGPEDRADLLRDLEAVAEIDRVQLDDGTGTRACVLGEAFAALEHRTARRVLVRYRHDERIWLDTLVLDPGDPSLVRLIRIAEDA